MQELLKASVDDAKGPPLDTLRVRCPSRERETTSGGGDHRYPLSEVVDAEVLVERTVRSRKKAQFMYM